jgi:hypothetical protein
MKRFFCHEKDDHYEAWYYLARDAVTGSVYVEHQWAASGSLGSNRIEIIDFLIDQSITTRKSLLRFIRPLATEDKRHHALLNERGPN